MFQFVLASVLFLQGAFAFPNPDSGCDKRPVLNGTVVDRFNGVYVYEDTQMITADDTIDSVEKCERYCIAVEGCMSFYYGTPNPCGDPSELTSKKCVLYPRHQMPPQDPTNFIYTVEMHNMTEGSVFGTKRDGKLQILANTVTWYHSRAMNDGLYEYPEGETPPQTLKECYDACAKCNSCQSFGYIERFTGFGTDGPLCEMFSDVGLGPRPSENSLGLVRYTVETEFGGTSGNVERPAEFEHSRRECQPAYIKNLIWELERCYLDIFEKGDLAKMAQYDSICEKNEKRSLIESCLVAPETLCMADESGTPISQTVNSEKGSRPDVPATCVVEDGVVEVEE